MRNGTHRPTRKVGACPCCGRSVKRKGTDIVRPFCPRYPRPLRFTFSAILLFALALPPAGCRSGKSSPLHPIRPVAGTGQEGYSGDGGAAPVARLYCPTGIDLDAKGNLFIADSWNLLIRKVDPTGIITTVAGTGKAGGALQGFPLGAFTPSSGPARRVGFGMPSGVVADPDGNLFIADGQGHCVWKLTPRGTMSIIAGTGKLGLMRPDGGLATRTDLAYPFDVAMDRRGNLYIADSWDHRIRRVDRKGILTTFAGDGKGRFYGDGGPAKNASFLRENSIEFDPAGNMYVADEDNNRVRKIDRKGIISTVAGTGVPGYSGDGGPALRAQLRQPSGVEADSRGNLFISDRANHRIRWVHPDGTITTLAGNGIDGHLAQIWRVFHGYGDNGPPQSASLAHPRHLVLDRNGNLYIVDGGNDRIRMIPGIAAPDH